jgi:hypothetical protein
MRIPPNFFLISLTTKIYNLKNIFDILVIGERDSPYATSGFRYFSALNS